MSRHGARAVSFWFRVLILLSLILGITVASSTAQIPGVTDSSVLIGSCSALDGPARFLGNQTVMGATAYLHSINDQGGVFGRKIQLLAFDDGYDRVWQHGACVVPDRAGDSTKGLLCNEG